MMNQRTLEVLDKIHEAGEHGKIFSVVFIKRSNGQKRTMLCRLGVWKYTKGIGLAFNPLDYQLCVVFDLHRNEYRMIPLDAVLEIRGSGKTIWKKEGIS